MLGFEALMQLGVIHRYDCILEDETISITIASDRPALARTVRVPGSSWQ